MGRSRRTPPLYEVMDDPARKIPLRRPVEVQPPPPRQKQPRESHAQERRSRPERLKPERTSSTTAHDRIHALRERMQSVFKGQKRINLSFSHLFIGIAIFLGLCVLIWTVAWRSGAVSKQEEILGTKNASGLMPTDPTLAGERETTTGSSSLSDGRGPHVSQTADIPGSDLERTSSNRPAVLNDEPASSETAYLNLAWQPGTDPRLDEHNYLHLAVLGYQEAVESAVYLTKHGVPTGIIPHDVSIRQLDRSVPLANNDTRWVVVVDKPIHSTEYKQTQRQRSRLEARVAELGRRFLREEQGASDFSMPLWKKYTRPSR